MERLKTYKQFLTEATLSNEYTKVTVGSGETFQSIMMSKAKGAKVKTTLKSGVVIDGTIIEVVPKPDDKVGLVVDNYDGQKIKYTTGANSSSKYLFAPKANAAVTKIDAQQQKVDDAKLKTICDDLKDKYIDGEYKPGYRRGTYFDFYVYVRDITMIDEKTVEVKMQEMKDPRGWTTELVPYRIFTKTMTIDELVANTRFNKNYREKQEADAAKRRKEEKEKNKAEALSKFSNKLTSLPQAISVLPDIIKTIQKNPNSSGIREVFVNRDGLSFWNAYIESFYITSDNELFANIYWQGDSTDGNETIEITKYTNTISIPGTSKHSSILISSDAILNAIKNLMK